MFWAKLLISIVMLVGIGEYIIEQNHRDMLHRYYAVLEDYPDACARWRVGSTHSDDKRVGYTKHVPIRNHVAMCRALDLW